MLEWNLDLTQLQKLAQAGNSQVPEKEVSLSNCLKIIFDIVGYDAGRTLCKRSSSRISQSADHPSGSLGRERSGLMRWSEQFFRPKLQDLEASNQQENDLFARAVQLNDLFETRGTRDDVSDDSGGKDEHIVRLDSPSSSAG